MIRNMTQGRRFLEEQGLNLLAVLDMKSIPAPVLISMKKEKIVLESYLRLVLIGSAGPSLWDKLREYGYATDHPIDRFSLAMGKQFLQEHLNIHEWLTIFPAATHLPLQQLGALAGWSHVSPLGLGIHARYGTWFAYRAAFLVREPIPITEVETSTSPCDGCLDKPCINACPVDAVRAGNTLNLEHCMNHRLQEASVCATRCLSRLACPVGRQYRYTEEQLTYHGRVSLDSLIRYRGQSV